MQTIIWPLVSLENSQSNHIIRTKNQILYLTKILEYELVGFYLRPPKQLLKTHLLSPIQEFRQIFYHQQILKF